MTPPGPTPRPDRFGNIAVRCTRCGEQSQHFALNPMPDICPYCYAAGSLVLAAHPAPQGEVE